MKLFIKLRYRAFFAVFMRSIKGHTPYLLTLFFTQIVKKLGESRNQISLGKHHIHRECHTQLVLQLLHPLFNGPGMQITLCFRLIKQVSQTGKHDDTVNGTPGPVFTQQA